MSKTGLRIAAAIFLVALVGPPAVYGQALMNCTASVPVPLSVRAEGLTELVGDIIITCTGGTPVATGAFPAYTVSIFMSTSVTSRVLVPSAPPLLDSLLLVDDPTPANQIPCLGTVCANTENVHQARLPQFNSVRWDNVPVNPPGGGSPRTLRIKNLRVNAVQLPANSQVIAFISMTGPNLAPLNAAQQTVANVRPSMNMDIRSITDGAVTGTPTYVACTGNNIDLANNSAGAYGSPGGRSFHIRFTEAAGFADAWKRRNAGTTLGNPGNVIAQEVPNLSYATETGFYNPNLPETNGLRRAGLADQGTRLRAVFTNIPSNAKVFVTTREVTPGTSSSGGNTTTKAVLSGSGVFAPVTPDSQADGGLKQISAGNEAVWEVLETDVAQLETVSFGVVVAYSGNPQPAAGTATVVGGYGPQSLTLVAAPGEAIPRFSLPLQPVNAFQINACRTTLLFQFVTNQAGFDTGIAITNTSKDTLGTLPQAGRCTVNFFPMPTTNQAAFPPLTSPSVLNAGEQWVFSISSVRSGFQGYLMVGCDFQFAHGYAFISDFGAQKLAQGYQALVIPDRPRVADPVSTAGAGTGEQLIH